MGPAWGMLSWGWSSMGLGQMDWLVQDSRTGGHHRTDDHSRTITAGPAITAGLLGTTSLLGTSTTRGLPQPSPCTPGLEAQNMLPPP